MKIGIESIVELLAVADSKLLEAADQAALIENRILEDRIESIGKRLAKLSRSIQKKENKTKRKK